MEEKNLELKPKIIRESEFFGGCIRVKISVKNASSLAIMDAALELESDERILHFDRCEPEYPEKKGKIILGNINPNSDRTIAFYLDPLICAKEGTDINIGRLKELVSSLSFHDSKVYTIPKRVEVAELLGTCRDVVLLHDVRHIKTFKTTDEKTYEAWYYGKTKVTKKDLVIKCCLRRDTESIEVFAAGDDPSDITGLLAEIGRNLAKEFERLGKVQPIFNITIKDSIIQRSNLLSFCDLDGTCGGDVVIEDSVVQRANIGSGNEGAQKEREEVKKREKEERERMRRQEEQEEERIAKERETLNVFEKNAGISQIKYLAVALVLGVVLLGYWALAPDPNNASENLESTPVPTQKVTPDAVQTPGFTPAVSQKPIGFSADQKTYTNSIGIEFMIIPAGEFDMGSRADEKDRYSDEGPVHRVKISNAFYMSKYEITQKQWSDVMGNNPSNFKGDNLPVEQVSWNDVHEFIKKLNENEGSNKYRLPSEAEWEYAARAGTTTRYSFGDDESKLGDYAWYDSNSGVKTHEVGQKKPNPWGLYDVHGNVWEWVQDIYHDSYSGVPTDGGAWEGVGSTHVSRGGGWGYVARDCRSALRHRGGAGFQANGLLGFRLLRVS